MAAYKHILVPTDGSPLSLKAAKAAATLAHSLNAKITAMHVIAPFAPPRDSESAIIFADAYTPGLYKKRTEEIAGNALDKIEAQAKALGVPCARVFVTSGAPWEAIIETAGKRKCDLIVMASHGRRGLAGLLLGSETTKVLTHSKIPVLVCR